MPFDTKHIASYLSQVHNQTLYNRLFLLSTLPASGFIQKDSHFLHVLQPSVTMNCYNVQYLHA